MSMAAVLKQVRTTLRAAFTDLPDDAINIEPDLEPPLTAPQQYIAIDEDSIQSTGQGNFLKEEIGILVGVWKRTGVHPKTKWRDIYLEHSTGLDALERLVIQSLHLNNTVRNALNTAEDYGSSPNGDKYNTPLLYRGRSKTEKRALPHSNSGDLQTWMMRILRFSGLERTQALDVMK